MRHPTRIAALSLALTALLSCGGDGPGTTEPDPPKAASITLSRTTIDFLFLGQTSVLTATVLDQYAATFNTTVTWSSADASVASVSSGGVVTAVGNGSTTITAAAGDLSVTAAVTVQQVPTRVSVVSGNNQAGTVGEALAEELVVRSDDQGGSPVPGAEVTFTITSGGGSVSQASLTTDGDAMGSVSWTLGTQAGTQEITAAIAGTNNGWATLIATAAAGPAAALLKTSGEGQLATVGLPLPDPVVVTVADEYGNGVSGRPVSFAVTGGGGSVSPSQATTGDDGTAQATWTMGPAQGANTLTASSEGLPPVTFTLTAEPARADLVVGTLETTPANPVSQQVFEVSATVTNAGHLSTGAGFRVQLLVDGADAGSVNLPALEAGGAAQASFSVGPLTGGAHTLQVVADVDGVVVESNEGNNQAQIAKSVATSQSVTAGTPISGIGASEGTEFLYTLEVSPSEPGTMVVETSGGIGDVDLYVHYGERPLNRDDYECQSGQPATEERCVFNAAEPGTYHILLYAWSDFSGATMTVTTGGPVVPYDIEIVFIDHGTTEQDAAVNQAADIWMSIITSDISDVDFSGNPIGPNLCTQGQPTINDVIDDVRIFVTIDSIDGSGGTLASAGPCYLRGLSELPAVGVMTFDQADLAALSAQGAMLDVILHEMGHVLGLGVIWDRLELLHNPSLPSSPGVDTYFSGTRAIEAFDEAGGSSVYTLGEKVPVANKADPGSSDSHWRESVLDNELMTPNYNSNRPNPLSAISIASMADIGYRVDMSQAEPFSKVYRAPQREAENRPLINLAGDVRTGPMYVVDGKGRVREVIRR